MKKLILLRHVEAGFSDGVDFQRQLTIRGKERLHRLGKNLRDRMILIHRMYCSGATRTRETAEIMKEYWEVEESIYSKEIYEGNLEILLKILENTPNAVQTCLMVGHNPIISLLLSHLTHDNYIGMEPGMVARLELDIQDWYMVGLGTGTLIETLQ